MSAIDVVLTLSVLALASVVQATAGFGFALVSMPLLSAVIGPASALATTSLVSIVNSGATAVTAWAHADRSSLRRMAIAAIVGMPIGLWVLEHASVRTMQIAISLTVAVAAVLVGSGSRLRRAGSGTEVVAGLLSGALGTSTGTSGPPIVLCLQSRGLPAAKLRATISSQFVATGWISILLLGARGHVHRYDVLVTLAALPILALSWPLGARSFHRLSQRHYDALVVALLLAVSAVGLAHALW